MGQGSLDIQYWLSKKSCPKKARFRFRQHMLEYHIICLLSIILTHVLRKCLKRPNNITHFYEQGSIFFKYFLIHRYVELKRRKTVHQNWSSPVLVFYERGGLWLQSLPGVRVSVNCTLTCCMLSLALILRWYLRYRCASGEWNRLGFNLFKVGICF